MDDKIEEVDDDIRFALRQLYKGTRGQIHLDEGEINTLCRLALVRLRQLEAIEVKNK